MREISSFSLERHAGAYETWPQRSRLIREGRVLNLALPGYALLRQYETVAGYLFVTDNECPFEESTHIILVDTRVRRVLSCRWFIGWYTSCLLDAFFWRGERAFSAVISGVRYDFVLRSFSIPYLYPKIECTRSSGESSAENRLL